MSQKNIHPNLKQDKYVFRVPSTPIFQRHHRSLSSTPTEVLLKHETSAKRLVDQFYTSFNASEFDQTPVSNSKSPGLSRKQSLHRFEIKSGNIPDDKLKLNELKEKVLQQLKTQLSSKDYEDDCKKFQEVLKGIESLKERLLDQLQEIESHYDEFKKDYSQRFKKRVKELFKNLYQINEMERNLKEQREILNQYKLKLKGIRTKIEINEELKSKNSELVRFRNKLGFISFLTIIVLWISMRLF